MFPDKSATDFTSSTVPIYSKRMQLGFILTKQNVFDLETGFVQAKVMKFGV